MAEVGLGVDSGSSFFFPKGKGSRERGEVVVGERPWLDGPKLACLKRRGSKSSRQETTTGTHTKHGRAGPGMVA